MGTIFDRWGAVFDRWRTSSPETSTTSNASTSELGTQFARARRAIARASALEAAVERADELVSHGDLTDARVAWERIVRVAGDLFGPYDPSVIDGERVLCTILARLGCIEDARSILTRCGHRLDGVVATSRMQFAIRRDLDRLDEITNRATSVLG